MLRRVERAEYAGDYKLRVTFTDNKVRVVDFSVWIQKGGALVEPLRDVEYFKKFHVVEDFKTICWPNDYDCCPDVLYEMGKEE